MSWKPSHLLPAYCCILVMLSLEQLCDATGTPPTPHTPPNILFILADDYGWNDVGYHGSEIRTPTLDKLAAEGVKLDNYYVQPICSPTRSQLLSGRYQIHTGLQHSVIHPPAPNGLPLEHQTLADKLKEAGYATHMVGKWHIGFYQKEYIPTNRGFDSFFGYLIGGEDYYTHRRCYTIHDDSGNVHACGVDMHDGQNPTADFTGQYSTHLFTDKAQQLVADHVRLSPDKPLFLYLPFQAVHSPEQVPEHYEDQYQFIQNAKRRTYAAMASCMDEAVANITDTFREHGIWDNTLLVFSTDNGGVPGGGGNNWPLRGTKNSLWEGGMRGVGFVHGKMLSQVGVVNKELVHVSDWLPTLVNLAGGSTNGMELDGFDVWDSISAGTESPRKEILHNIDPVTHPKGEPLPNASFDVRVRAAIRRENWKLITGDCGDGHWYPTPDAHVEEAEEPDTKNYWLFDLSTDPDEREDLSEKYPDVVNSLLDRLSYYNSTAVPCRFPDDDPASDPSNHDDFWVPWMNSSSISGSIQQAVPNSFMFCWFALVFVMTTVMWD